MGSIDFTSYFPFERRLGRRVRVDPVPITWLIPDVSGRRKKKLTVHEVEGRMVEVSVTGAGLLAPNSLDLKPRSEVQVRVGELDGIVTVRHRRPVAGGATYHGVELTLQAEGLRSVIRSLLDEVDPVPQPSLERFGPELGIPPAPPPGPKGAPSSAPPTPPARPAPVVQSPPQQSPPPQAPPSPPARPAPSIGSGSLPPPALDDLRTHAAPPPVDAPSAPPAPVATPPSSPAATPPPAVPPPAVPPPPGPPAGASPPPPPMPPPPPRGDVLPPPPPPVVEPDPDPELTVEPRPATAAPPPPEPTADDEPEPVGAPAPDGAPGSTDDDEVGPAEEPGTAETAAEAVVADVEPGVVDEIDEVADVDEVDPVELVVLGVDPVEDDPIEDEVVEDGVEPIDADVDPVEDIAGAEPMASELDTADTLDGESAGPDDAPWAEPEPTDAEHRDAEQADSVEPPSGVDEMASPADDALPELDGGAEAEVELTDDDVVIDVREPEPAPARSLYAWFKQSSQNPAEPEPDDPEAELDEDAPDAEDDVPVRPDPAVLGPTGRSGRRRL